MFVPSGTQSNLIGVMTHCARGDEYIVGQEAHTYRYEAGGAAVLGSVQPQPLNNAADGTIPLPDIEAAIKPHDVHFARTRLIALENTIGGRVLPAGYAAAAREIAAARGLAMHLDGARLWNAAVKQGVPPRTIAQDFDSVSVCLSKGLGAPVGSVLCGSRDFITEARRWRKMLGGGMRQAGIIAAAGRYAIAHNIARLAEDHEHAARLAAGLARHAELAVSPAQTNMVFVGRARNHCGGVRTRISRRTASGPTARRGSAGARTSTSRGRTSMLRSPASTGSSRSGTDGRIDGAIAPLPQR